MSTVYEKYAKDFSNVSAYVILNNKHQKTGIITIKHPKNHEGKLTAYLHLYGSKMQSYSVRGMDTYTISQAFKNLAQKVLEGDPEFSEFFTDSALFCSAIVKDGFTFNENYQIIANYGVMRAV